MQKAGKSYRRPLAAALLATSILSSSGLAAAQEAADKNLGQDIVVTAQKRSEALQSVPISIQALGTQKLDQLQVRNFADYMQFLPSANFTAGSVGILPK